MAGGRTSYEHLAEQGGKTIRAGGRARQQTSKQANKQHGIFSRWQQAKGTLRIHVSVAGSRGWAARKGSESHEFSLAHGAHARKQGKSNARQSKQGKQGKKAGQRREKARQRTGKALWFWAGPQLSYFPSSARCHSSLCSMDLLCSTGCRHSVLGTNTAWTARHLREALDLLAVWFGPCDGRTGKRTPRAVAKV